jgi:hypothetical protein
MAKSSKRGRRRSTGGNAIPVPARSDESESLRIRPISNGYLITRSGQKRGKYFEHEEYSASKPVVTATVPSKPKGR